MFIPYRIKFGNRFVYIKFRLPFIKYIKYLLKFLYEIKTIHNLQLKLITKESIFFID